VTRPEEAVGAARAAAAAARDRGEYADDLGGLTVAPTHATSVEKLLEWAVVEPDIDLVYSTSRFGRPIWSLRQYNGQVYGQQTRFNHHIGLYGRRLEDRVAELEQQVAAREREKERGDEA